MSDDPDAVASLRAVAHPLRLQILSLLTGAPMSAAEIARELDLTHANASYHLRVLAEAGEVVEAGVEKIRGGVAKRYRHPWDRLLETPSSAGPDLSDADRVRYVQALGTELVRRFRQRRPGSRSYIADAEMWVSPDVWAQVTALVDEAARLLHAEAQAPRSAGTLHVNLSAAAFEMRRP
jgi:DNA-binding transcriptional ArsR family regulator